MNVTQYPLIFGMLAAALLVAIAATTIRADEAARIPAQQLSYRTTGESPVVAQEVRWGRRYYGGYGYGPYGAYYGPGPYHYPGPRYYSGYRGFDGPYYGRGYRYYGGPYGYGYPYGGGVRVGGGRVFWR